MVQDFDQSSFNGVKVQKSVFNRTQFQSKYSQNYSTNQIHLETISYNNPYEETPKLNMQSKSRGKL